MMHWKIKLPNGEMLSEVYESEDSAYDAKDALEEATYGIGTLEVVEIRE